MDDETGQGNSILRGIVRRVVPWIALIVVTTLAWSYYTGYRDAMTAGPPVDKAPAVDASGTVSPEGTYVLVVSNELNLRADAMTTATIIKKLKKDEKLTLLEKTSSWYKVKDATGSVGWVAAGEQYTKLVEE